METAYADALTDFVDSLVVDVVEEEKPTETFGKALDQSGGWTRGDNCELSNTGPVTSEPAATTPVDAWTTPATRESADGVWHDITESFDNWLMRLVDIERRISTSKSLKGKHINQSIEGMLEDGLLGYSEASELRFIGHCWMQLTNAYTLYSAGCHSYKSDIISSLLDLYSAKQVTKGLCMEICGHL